MQIKTVELKKILPTESGRRLFEEDISPLSDKFRPTLFSAVIILQAHADGYKILYGFDIVDSLIKAGTRTLQAFIIPGKMAFITALNITADFVLRLRPIFPIEVARCLAECGRQRVSGAEMSELFRNLTTTELTASLEERYTVLLRLDPVIIQFLNAKNAPLKTWIVATELPLSFQSLVQKIVLDCRPSLSVFEEIVRNILEIFRREEAKSESLIGELETVLSKNDGQSSKMLENLRAIVQERRFPYLTKSRQEVLDILKKVKLPPSIRIDYDKNFEERGFSLIARIGTADELATLRKFLNSATQAQLDELLKKL